jgi:hypothetical protein
MSTPDTSPDPLPKPAETEWIVIRPEGDVEFTELADTYEGQWRRRSELTDQDVIETMSPDGIVRAYPTGRIEQSPAGDLAQVYEVPQGSPDDDEH